MSGNGHPVFVGRVRCIMCGSIGSLSPRISSHWRCVELDGERYYACWREFPPDGAAKGAYRRAYAKVLAKALLLWKQKREDKASEEKTSADD